MPPRPSGHSSRYSSNEVGGDHGFRPSLPPVSAKHPQEPAVRQVQLLRITKVYQFARLKMAVRTGGWRLAERCYHPPHEANGAPCFGSSPRPDVGGNRTEALYPPRPQVLPGPALADPPNSRVNMHISLTESGPRCHPRSHRAAGRGAVFVSGQRKLAWKRTPVELRFNNAASTIGVKATITAQASVATNPTFSITLTADVQPALGSDYAGAAAKSPGPGPK